MDIVFNSTICGMSEKKDGSMKLDANSELIQANRASFFASKGLNINDVVSAGLKHSNNVRIVSLGDKGKIIESTDGLITSEPGLVLSATFADCVPIFYHDPVRSIVGLAHAGWRGVVSGISTVMADKMVKECGSSVGDVKVCVGPHIKKCHFEIGLDIIEQFEKYSEFIARHDNKIYVDLASILIKQLTDFGLTSKNIEINQECTFENSSKYFSYRRDKPEQVEAMVAYISLI
jgi:YfiH family protein